MKKIIALLLIILLISTFLFAQEQKPVFVGIQPSFTKEKFYENNEFDINVLPLVVQFSISKRIDLRIGTVLNYHFGDNPTVSDVGIQTVAPIFIRKNENKNKASNGFYIAPVLGLGQNLMNEHFTTTLAIEPGYQFTTNSRFAFSVGVQYGRSNFAYKNAGSEWVEHFGVKLNLGFWL